jgi:hypothetical protein
MKTILLAAMGAIAMVAPLHAADAKPFKVKNVSKVSVNGQLPIDAPKFSKGSILDLTITPKVFKGPKKISIPIKSKSKTANIYFKSTGPLAYAEATVRKNATTGKVTSIDLTYFGPVDMGSGVTSPGQVSYTLVPK